MKLDLAEQKTVIVSAPQVLQRACVPCTFGARIKTHNEEMVE